MNYCVEFKNLPAVKNIDLKGIYNFRLSLKAIDTEKKFYDFTGFIATLDKKYRLGYGMRSFWQFQWNKGFTFHETNEKDDSQKFIFSKITPISYFSQN